MWKRLITFIRIKILKCKQPEIPEDIDPADDEQDLLYCTNYKLTDKITIHIPTLKEILTYGEDNYFKVISMILSTSKDYMVQLDDIGVDYEEITDFELFSQILFTSLKEMNASLVLSNLNLADFELCQNKVNDEIVLYSEKDNVIIDRYVHSIICDKLREIHYIEKDRYKAGNKEAKAFMIERARKKQKRASKKPYKPVLRPMIISLVNCQEFKYNYTEALELNIFQFYSSVKAIQKRINFDQIMSGIYTGSISSKDINMQEINWLG